MAQALLDSISFKLSNTEQFEFYLSPNKLCKFYKSQHYHDYVLSIPINTSKNLIITRAMWNNLSNYMQIINNEFRN